MGIVSGNCKSRLRVSENPNDALFILLEGWLDEASKKMLRASQVENPTLTYLEFFQRLNREMMQGPLVGRKDR